MRSATTARRGSTASPLLLLLALAALAATAARAQRPEPCSTPDKAPGTCVVLFSCTALFSLLQGPRPLNPQVINFLRDSNCGFQGKNPKVCCPTGQPTPGPPPTLSPPPLSPPPPPRPTPRPPDAQDMNDNFVNVQNDPNLRLLPHQICGPSNTNRIINGNATVVLEYPWMARLGYKSSRNGNIAFRCGGSLINSRYVLTAAHCVEGIKSTEALTTVRLGEHDVQSDKDCSVITGVTVCAPPVVDVGVEETVSHPEFSLDGPNRLQNDVALVRLERRVKFTDAVRPICLPVGDEQFNLLDNKKVTVAGWGTTESGYGSRELLQVNVPVVPGARCVDVYKTNVRIAPAKQLCAGGTREGDSCNGDSGGPLKYAGLGVGGDLRTIQFGIVSFGPRKCGSEGMPGVYTRVGYYMQWILNNIRA